MANRRKKHKPYGDLSSRRRKQIYIRMKNQIRRSAPNLGGLFYTHDYMHGQNGWIDLYFIGKNRVVYNVTLETTRCAYKEAVSDAAWDAADARLPRKLDLFSKSVKDPVTGLWTLHREPEVGHAEYDGLTRFEFVQREERRIADAGTVKVFEHWTLHRDYAFGVGLHATIDVPFLTVDAVNDFIRRFIEDGEKAYQSSEAKSYTHDEIAHWGLESNAIVEPWEYSQSGDQSA